MIEIIYKEEQKKADGNESFFKIPNNIRQIGDIKGHQKIYIEDYAYTFLKKISRSRKQEGKAAILFGRYHWSEGNAYLFIKSVLEIFDMEVSQEHVVFSDKVWGQVYEDSKKYFPEQEIVGWFVSIPGFNMQMNEMLLKTHLNHFAGNDKTLFVVEPGEWEEAFFLYENNQLIRQPGYYIYYEKNDLMQSYMIEMSQNKSIEETEKIPDRAVADFRKAVKEKKEGERETPGQGKKVNLGWAAGTCAAAAVLAIGITFFNSYQNIQGTLDNWIPGVYAQEESEIASVENVQVTLTPTAPAAKEEKTETEMETIRTEDVQQKTENLPADDDLADEVKEEADIPIADEEDSELPVQNTDISGSEYVIKRGDTMTSICKEKYGTIDRIEEVCRANGITPEDIIYAGQKIILPD